MKSIIIANDHAGVSLKFALVEMLQNMGYVVNNVGCDSEESVDYPDYAHIVGKAVDTGEFEKGIVICGSGNGVNMVVNKYKNVRSALCWNSEIAKLARLHNNANVISLPARYLSVEEGKFIISEFLSTSFEGGRHQKRVDKI
jgi:ribose 5-phosphate isomerase B